MPENITAQTLVKHLKTQQNAKSLILELENLLSLIYNPTLTQTNHHQAINSYPMLMNIVTQENLQEEVIFQRTFVEAIKTCVEKIEICHIKTCSADLKVVEHLSEWVALNIPEPVLLKITLDAQIRGGLTLIYKGIHKDWALETSVQNYVKNHYDNHS